MGIVSGTQEYPSDQVDDRGKSILKGLVGFLLFPSLAIGLILGAAVMGLVYFENSHQGRIFPGVVIWGIELGGMTPEDARVGLTEAFPYPNQIAFTFRDPGTGIVCSGRSQPER